MARAFLVVLDSVGCGGAPDAATFFNGKLPDTGANTLLHIAQACAQGRAEQGRSGPLNLPNLDTLGLGAAVRLATNTAIVPGLAVEPKGLWGAATEVSRGKDTPSGHWELAGVPVPWEWHYFPDTNPAFPPEITRHICELAGTEGILGNCHASGLPVIEQNIEAHLKTGWPICYTSVDSVFQIAAHEEVFGLERLQKLCADAAPMLHAMRVGRVISRPFLGTAKKFWRTTNRRDYAMKPPGPTLAEWVEAAGGTSHAIGKIGDIFSMRGFATKAKGADADLMTALLDNMRDCDDGSFTFANFVEFDTLYGHQRDISGYARALEWFDTQVPAMLAALRPDDLLIFTADHGNDPSWVGTDHTRERVPVVGAGYGVMPIGLVGFADVGASIAAHLGLHERGAGNSFIPSNQA